ncbi:uncharacterized protein LOC129286203 [Prosopis cineraria]|uniref:uncharacterized protein LOC129286203 n=1 Tax=Prosopis cineraria TaxID=364024 RepID=UPI00240FCD0A|nr:uncharacterized protein LOC129286203 [Prosopis cineraria]
MYQFGLFHSSLVTISYQLRPFSSLQNHQTHHQVPPLTLFNTITYAYINKKITIKESLIFTTTLLLVTFFYSITTSAQLSPLQPQAPSPPKASPAVPATVPAPGFNTVPLVPASPNGAPTPAMTKRPTIDIVQILREAKEIPCSCTFAEGNIAHQPTQLAAHDLMLQQTVANPSGASQMVWNL